MTSHTLDDHWSSFQNDPDTRNHLFTACVSFARQRISASDPQRDDIAHDSAWRAWRHFGTLPADTHFSRWFGRVLTNTQRDHRRKAFTRNEYEITSAYTPIATTAIDWTERDAMLDAAGDQRGVVSRLLQGDTLDEIAHSLNTTVRTLRRRLNALRKERSKNG